MLWAKLNTAITRNVGPILDSTGAEYTGAVIGDLTIRKSDGSGAAMASAATLTHVDNGHYTLVTTTGNMDTVGRLEIRCNKATYQMPPVEMMVLPAAVYDTLITNGTLASNTSGRTQVVDANGLGDSNMVKAGPTGAGTAQTARDLGLALPAVAPNAAGGLLVTAAGSLDMDEMNVDIEAIQVSTASLTFTGAGKVDASVRDWVGDTIPARNVTGVPIIDLKYILGTVLTETAGQIAAAFKKFFDKATPTGTVNSLPDAVPDASGGLPVTGNRLTAIPVVAHVTLVDTSTALTNAPTSGDLTATMKTSVQTAADAAISANVLVLEIEADTDTLTAGVTVTTNNDKTGYGLSAAAVQAIWDAATSALTTAGSIGKRLVDFVTTLVYAAAPTAVQNRQEMDSNSTKLANLDVASSTLGTATNLAEANADLDELITTIGVAGAGLTGVTGTGPTAVQIRQEIDSNSTALAEINADADEMIVTLANILADTDASLAYASGSVVTGTVGSATTPSTTQFTPSALGISCVDADQLRGSVIVFLTTTTTGGLKAQKSIILHSSAAALPLITLGNPDTDTTTPLTRAPSAGDVFFIL